MIFPLCSSVDSDGKSLHYLDSEQLKTLRNYSSYRKEKTVVLLRGGKEWINFKTHERGHSLRLKSVICRRETTAKPQWPVNWKRHHSGANTLLLNKT